MAGGKGTDGFSLLEVMIALGILSIGLLALASLFSSTQRTLSIGNKETIATRLAHDKMEELRATRPALIESADTAEGMTRRWSIAQNKDNPMLWIITVEVVPLEDQGSIVLQSMVFY
jgi:type IV pilus modification protein PilV